MKYRVVVQPDAESEAEEAYLYIRERSPVDATRWFNGLFDAIGTLETFPRRCPVARESRTFHREIRQLVHGRGQHAYRILFTVEGKEVHVLHVRRGSRRGLRSKE